MLNRLWTLTLDVPQMTQRSYHLESLIVVFADDCQNVEMVFLNCENEEQSPFLFIGPMHDIFISAIILLLLQDKHKRAQCTYSLYSF